MFDKKTLIIIIFVELTIFVSTSLQFELLIIRNKPSSQEDFKVSIIDYSHVPVNG